MALMDSTDATASGGYSPSGADDAFRIIGAIGSSLLTGTRQNPFANVPYFVAQQNKQADAFANKVALKGILKEAGFDDAKAEQLASSPENAKLAIALAQSGKQAKADALASTMLGGLYTGGGSFGSPDGGVGAGAGLGGGLGSGSAPATGAGSASAPAKRSSFDPATVPTFVQQAIAQPEVAETGISPDYLAKTGYIESRHNPLAVSSTGAKGVWQFTGGTGSDYGLVGKGFDKRFDPNASAVATANLAADNRDYLRDKLGRDPTDDELYLAHQQGAAGAAGLLLNPDAPASSIVGRKAIAVNGGNPNMTAGQFAGLWQSKYKSLPGTYGGGTQVASADTGGAAPSATAPDNRPAYARPVGSEPGAYGMPGGPGGPASAPIRVADASGRVPLPGARGAPPVGYADDEASTQALERSTGQLAAGGLDGGAGRTRIANANSPAPGASETGFVIPGSSGAPVSAQTLGRMPQPSAANPMSGIATVFNDPNTAMIAVDRANRALAIPGLSDTMRSNLMKAREDAMTLLKPTEQTRKLIDMGLRPGTQEFTEAQRRLTFGTKTPDGFEADPQNPGALRPIQGGPQDLSRMSAETAAKTKDQDKIVGDALQREIIAERYGIKRGTPEFATFVVTGKMPNEDKQGLSVSDRNAIRTADDQVLANQNVIDNLKQAKTISKQAYQGFMASQRGMLTSTFGNEAGLATTDLDNLVTGTALGQLKSIFGGNPTEGERAILLQIQGSSSLPDAARQKIYDRAIGLAQQRLEMNQQRAAELRGGTYYKPRAGSDEQAQKPPTAPTGPAFSQSALEAEARRRGLMP